MNASVAVRHHRCASPFALRAGRRALACLAATFLLHTAGVSPALFAEEPRAYPGVEAWNVETRLPARPSTAPDVAATNASAVADQPLVDVRVEGNRTIPETAILHFVKSQRGRPVSAQTIKEDIATLLTLNWFFRVSTEFRSTPEGVVLVFQVVEKPILRSVRFIGNSKVKTQVLEDMTGLREGHGFDVGANKEAAVRIQQYYREKGYYFATVTLATGGRPDDRDAIFEIDEGRKVRVQHIRFDGNDDISSGVLKTKLGTKTALLWWIGGNYDPQSIKNDAESLTRYYHALGYFDANVEAAEEFSRDKSDVRVTFRVTEGTRFRVRSREVIGNAVIPTDKLFDDNEMLEGDYFNERLLQADVRSMQSRYDDLGRLFAKVQPVPRFLEEPGWVDVVYQIDEDKPYRIGQVNVNIAGDHPHSREFLVLNQVNRWIKPGELARMSDIQSAQKILRGSTYWDREQPAVVNVRPVEGTDYMPPQLLARGQDGVPAQAATCSLEATGEPVGFGHSVRPLEPTSRSPAAVPATGDGRLDRGGFTHNLPASAPQNPLLASASYNIDPEAVFRNADEDEFIYRGQSIDRRGQPIPYDPMQTTSPQGDPFGDSLRNPATPGFVDVDVDVSEARTGRLMFGVGVNSDAGVVASITLQEDNFDILRPPTSWADIVNGTAFRGAGQSFRLELVPGTQVSRYLVNWQNPYFLNTDFSLGLSGFYYNRYYDEWTEERVGGRISVGRLLNRYWSAGMAVRLENVNIDRFRMPAPTLVTDVAGDNFLSTLQYTLSHDTRDSPFLPTEGHLLELTYEQGFGEFTYPRADVSGSQYFTLWQRPDGYGKHLLQFRGQVAYTGDDTPVFERLYAGGYSSFRGFAFRGVSPQDLNFAVGGQFMTLGTVEYMAPITADDNIRAVVFSDFGTVDNNVSLSDFRVTAGCGLRLAIPAMGPAPIALDFAWPILSQPFDDERIFSFYVGFNR